jgi:mono/diheme cytochrome c family protein
MRSLIVAFILILFVPAVKSQEPGQTLSAEAQKGQKLYFQRCSICHLSVPRKYQAYGPPLHKEIVAALGDDALRLKIMEGSQTMPGWKYTLKPAEVDDIIAYLKTVTKAEVTHQGSTQDEKNYDD